jgi:hypothetical protein
MTDKKAKTPPRPKPGAHLVCGEPSPKLPVPFPLKARVKCNRIAGHVGPHRKVRAVDFTTTVEWDDHRYLIPTVS